MAKLTAAQERSIETVLYYLEKAQAYIDQEQTVVARLKTQCTTTLDYEILAATIKRHGIERIDMMDYPTQEAQDAARLCAAKIAGTFAHFANVNKEEFLKACGML